jgi:hypothetical protein
MHQCMRLLHVVDVYHCAHDRVHQARIGVHANVNTKGLPASW